MRVEQLDEVKNKLILLTRFEDKVKQEYTNSETLPSSIRRLQTCSSKGL